MTRDLPTPGAIVVDRDDDDPNEAVVVNVPGATADDWTAYPGTTIAEDNPDYPADAFVVCVVFRQELEAARPEYEGEDKLALADLNCPFYSFPRPRLKVIEGRCTEVHQVSPEDLSYSPYNTVDYDLDNPSTAEYLADVKAGAPLGSMPKARENGDGLELVDGHFRTWLARQAGLDRVAVRVLDLDDDAAAEAYAEAHGMTVGELQPRENPALPGESP